MEERVRRFSFFCLPGVIAIACVYVSRVPLVRPTFFKREGAKGMPLRKRRRIRPEDLIFLVAF